MSVVRGLFRLTFSAVVGFFLMLFGLAQLQRFHTEAVGTDLLAIAGGFVVAWFISGLIVRLFRYAAQ